ncbi:hypothetical protein [Nonomuraea sp. KM90]|uniref:hypothetical protein n=1 Tax=Nonomuraea sp. KM90 TaxID=3457428 RepID=UPI003FCD3EC8
MMIWLRCNHGRQVSYADIAAGVKFPNGHRLRRAVRVVGVIAANRGVALTANCERGSIRPRPCCSPWRSLWRAWPWSSVRHRVPGPA